MRYLDGHIQQMALALVREVSGLPRVVDSYLITPTNRAVAYQALDLGSPEVRAVSQPMPDGDGTLDFSRYTGASAVSLTLSVFDQAYTVTQSRMDGFRPEWNSASWHIQRLNRFLGGSQPGTRTYLYFTMSGESRPHLVPLTQGRMVALIDGEQHDERVVLLQFVNPDGKLYAFEHRPGAGFDGRSKVEIGVVTGDDAPGIVFPVTWPVTWPADATGTGQRALVSRGMVDTVMVAQVNSGSGPLGDPRITVRHYDDDGIEDFAPQTIGLTGYSLPAGQFLTIDGRSREIYLGYSRANRLGGFLGDPTFPVIRPGRNEVELSSGTSVATSDAKVTVRWYDAFLAV